jgi:hypothetical protein
MSDTGESTFPFNQSTSSSYVDQFDECRAITMNVMCISALLVTYPPPLFI